MGNIEIYIEPGKVVTREDFISGFPTYSIGLDGLVNAPSFIFFEGPYANFDHHVTDDDDNEKEYERRKPMRTTLRSTTDQVYMKIKLGLFNLFEKNNHPYALACANDSDQDVCTATWLLKNHKLLFDKTKSETIDRLVRCVDRLDTTAGEFPLDDIDMREKMAYMFEPYNTARFNGTLRNLDAQGHMNIIKEAHERITQYVNGQAKRIPLQGNYEIIGKGNGWMLIRETGPASRMAMYYNGIQNFITLVSENREKGIFHYVYKKNEFCDFPLNKIVKKLNEVEADIVTETNRHGVDDTVGGSPRETGSEIPPEQMLELVDDAIKEN